MHREDGLNNVMSFMDFTVYSTYAAIDQSIEINNMDCAGPGTRSRLRGGIYAKRPGKMRRDKGPLALGALIYSEYLIHRLSNAEDEAKVRICLLTFEYFFPILKEENLAHSGKSVDEFGSVHPARPFSSICLTS